MTMLCDSEEKQHSGSVTLQAEVSGDISFLTAFLKHV